VLWLTPKTLARIRVRILVQNATKRHPALPGVPLLLDFAKNDQQKSLLNLLAAPHRIGRPYLAPPGVSADRLQILRAAFEATLSDPLFLAEAEKAKLAINPVTGREMESIIAEVARMEPSVIQAMVSARADKGGAH
jgi:hypothetical protein